MREIEMAVAAAQAALQARRSFSREIIVERAPAPKPSDTPLAEGK